MRSDRSPAELRLAPARADDLPAIAALHLRAFPDSAMSVFGIEAVRRYYAWLLDGPHEAALVTAWHGPRLVGFCAAGWYRGAMNGFLRKNRAYLAGQVLRHPTLLRSAFIRERVGQALQITLKFSRLGKRRETAPAVSTPRFGVLSIATDPDVRGSGAGRALMLDAEQRARAGGHARMTLTVHPDNARGVKFYEQLGWERRPAPDGTWSGNMEKLLQ